MIVVTGSARTGTSLIMQTLNLLGVEIPVPAFEEVHKDIRQYNPKGFFEFKDEDSVDVSIKNKGKAVKLFGGQLRKWLDTPNCIEKVIITRREKKDAVKSSVPVYDKLEIDIDPGLLYDVNYGLLLGIQRELPTHFVWYEDMIKDPSVEIGKIIDFLKLDVSNEQLESAINNVD